MKSQEFRYNGQDELHVMQYCKNYNLSICNHIVTYISNKQYKVVDFGAGIGTLADIMKEKGYNVECVEIDSSQIDILRKKFVVHTSLDAIPDKSVNFFYSSNVLEHIENDEEILSILAKKLCAGGSMFLYLPAFQTLYTQMDEKVGHFRRYQAKDLREKLIRAGFNIKMMKYADSLGFVATFVMKLLNNGATIVTPEKVRFYDQWLFPFSAKLDLLLSRFFGKNIMVHATCD